MLSADQSVSGVASLVINFLKQVDSSPRTVEFAVGSGIRNPLILWEPVAEIYVSFHRIIHLLIPCLIHFACIGVAPSQVRAIPMHAKWIKLDLLIPLCSYFLLCTDSPIHIYTSSQLNTQIFTNMYQYLLTYTGLVEGEIIGTQLIKARSKGCFSKTTPSLAPNEWITQFSYIKSCDQD